MKILRNVLLVLTIVVYMFLLLGCVEGQNPSDAASSEQIIIEHELEKIAIVKEPERVIVFDYGVLDILDNIGVDIIGLPQTNVPAYLDKYKGDDYIDVGTLKEPNFETIYELQPDLIIISGRQLDLYDEFKKIAPTLYLNIDGGDYINSFKFSLEVLGKIFDKEEVLSKEFKDIEAKIAKLNELANTSGKNGLFIMANDGNLSAFGPGSRFGVVHKEFGIQPTDGNIEDSTHGSKVTFEYILEMDPDILYVLDRATIAGGDVSAKQVLDNDIIKSTKAYENNNIIYLDPYIWYVTAGGLTATNKMIDEIQSSLE